eukprot:1278382-Rhodomonas_salina.1
MCEDSERGVLRRHCAESFGRICAEFGMFQNESNMHIAQHGDVRKVQCHTRTQVRADLVVMAQVEVTIKPRPGSTTRWLAVVSGQGEV